MRIFRPASLIALAVVAAACSSEDAGVEVATAPQLSKADGGDRADRGCQIVLGQLARPAGPTGGFASSNGWYAWEGDLRVAPEAVANAQPRVLYGVFGQWYSVAATATGQRDGGLLTYRFRIDQNTVREGTSFTSLSRFRMQVIPYLDAPGGRVFDHNRLAGDFETYEVHQQNGFAIAADAGVCRFADVARKATVVFDGAWRTEQRGAIVAGGELSIEYALGRLEQCRGTHNGHPAWDVRAIVRFSPGGETVEGSVRAFETVNGFPTTRASAIPLLAAVPRSATRAEVWFHNTGINCSAWDSNFGANYRFDVVAAPAAPTWAGDPGSCFNRDCVRHDGVASDVRIDSYLMERACMFVETDVYVPGTTDAAALAPAHVLARVVTKADGATETVERAEFQGRTGNNYRYRWQIDRGWMSRNAWHVIEWRYEFSTDGTTWTAADGGWRTLTKAF